MTVTIVGLQVFPYFQPDHARAFGGAELQLYLLATGLARAGHTVNLISWGNPQDNGTLRQGVRLWFIAQPYTSSRIINALLFLGRFLKTLWQTESAWYIQRAVGVETGLTSLFCLLRGRHFCYMTANEPDVTGETEAKLPFHERWLYRTGIRLARLVLVQTQEQQRLLRRHYQKPSKVFRNLLPRSSPVRVYRRKGVLWVASAQPKKQAELALDLARALPGTSFTLIMPTLQQYADYAHGIATRARTLPNVRLIPHVSPNAIGSYFARATVFLNTSTHEGFPNTFLQAASAGTPILSLTVDPDRILVRHRMGLVAQGSVSTLRRHLQTLVRSPSRRMQMGERGRAYALRFHDLGVGITTFERLLREASGLVER